MLRHLQVNFFQTWCHGRQLYSLSHLKWPWCFFKVTNLWESKICGVWWRRRPLFKVTRLCESQNFSNHIGIEFFVSPGMIWYSVEIVWCITTKVSLALKCLKTDLFQTMYDYDYHYSNLALWNHFRWPWQSVKNTVTQSTQQFGNGWLCLREEGL